MKSLLWDIDITTGIKQSGSYDGYVRVVRKRFPSLLQRIIDNKGEFIVDTKETDDRLIILITGTDFSENIRSLVKSNNCYQSISDSSLIKAFEETLVLTATILTMLSSNQLIENVLSERFINTLELCRNKRQERFLVNQKIHFPEIDAWDWLSTECEFCGKSAHVAYETTEGKHALCLNCESVLNNTLGIYAWDLKGNHDCVITGDHGCINYCFDRAADKRHDASCTVTYTLTPRILKSVLTNRGNDLPEAEYKTLLDFYGEISTVNDYLLYE